LIAVGKIGVVYGTQKIEELNNLLTAQFKEKTSQIK
jgi:hypothetical protein